MHARSSGNPRRSHIIRRGPSLRVLLRVSQHRPSVMQKRPIVSSHEALCRGRQLFSGRGLDVGVSPQRGNPAESRAKVSSISGISHGHCHSKWLVTDLLAKDGAPVSPRNYRNLPSAGVECTMACGPPPESGTFNSNAPREWALQGPGGLQPLHADGRTSSS